MLFTYRPALHSSSPLRRPTAGSGLARRGLLGLLLLGGGPLVPAARAQQLLDEVNTTFALRLENTCRYAQAVLGPERPDGNAYLAVGRRRFLLETNEAGAERVRDVYRLGTTAPGDTVSTAKARYAQSTPLRRRGKAVYIGTFHNYFTPIFLEAQQFLTQQEFSPQEVLLLHLDSARTGQRVWVQNTAANADGDTLAGYQLTRAGGWWRLVLTERRPNASRRWRHNTRVTCEWSLNPSLRQVSARQPSDRDNGYATHWERTYTTGTDFTETCFTTHPIQNIVNESPRDEVYERRFRQFDATHTRDDYTLPAWDNQPPLTFTVLGLGPQP